MIKTSEMPNAKVFTYENPSWGGGGGGSGAPDVLVDERMERGGPQKC